MMGSFIQNQELGGPVSGCSLVLDYPAVLITGNELPSRSDLSTRGRKNELVPVEESHVIGSQEDPINSPVGSFQSL